MHRLFRVTNRFVVLGCSVTYKSRGLRLSTFEGALLLTIFSFPGEFQLGEPQFVGRFAGVCNNEHLQNCDCRICLQGICLQGFCLSNAIRSQKDQSEGCRAPGFFGRWCVSMGIRLTIQSDWLLLRIFSLSMTATTRSRGAGSLQHGRV